MVSVIVAWPRRAWITFGLRFGLSARTKHHWAGWFCPKGDRGCDVDWATEAEVFDHWINSVRDGAKAVKDDDPPPF
jgi:hypothetical protein